MVRHWSWFVPLLALFQAAAACHHTPPAEAPVTARTEPAARDTPGRTTGQLVLRRSSRALPLDGLLLRVFVDGDDHGTIPAVLEDIAPGEHQVRVVDFTERYAPFETTVTVLAGKSVAVEPELVVLRGEVTVSAGPGAAGSRVRLVTGDETQPIPRLPIVIEVTPQDDVSEIVAQQRGHQDFVYRLDFSDGVAKKRVVIAFE